LSAVLLAADVALAQATEPSSPEPPATHGDRIRLAELVPALAGTELGATDLGPAPPPGASRAVRRAEVVEALRRLGRSADGLALPREMRIARRAVRLSGEEIASRARAAISEALAPCEVQSVVVSTSATLGEGELAVEVEGPAPVVAAGAEVSVVVRSGNVRVAAPGIARQAGRVGDEVRVRVGPTGALVTARVIDAGTVEVRP
jgi:hypothetical protein